MSGVSDDFPVQLATRLPDWSAGGLSVFFCEDVTIMVRGRYEKTASVEFKLYPAEVTLPKVTDCESVMMSDHASRGLDTA